MPQHACRTCGTVVSDRTLFCTYCGSGISDARPDDALGESLQALFKGEFRVEREIGRGTTGAVFVAYDPALDRRVAIKTMLPDLADNPDLVERFQREARTVAALQHPNIVAVYGVRSNDATTAIIMQFVEGRALDVALEEHSPLPIGVAGLVLAQVAAGLSHAHERGIVHRDVKPANVLLADNGLAVVSDFGIARRDGAERMTASGIILGTIAYMSPEQVVGAIAEPASDQYSLGVMAYELLSGQRPFRGTAADVMFAHLNSAPTPLNELRPDLSPVVSSYVMRMLEKDAARRHATLRDARRIFGSLVTDEASAATQIVSISQARAATPPSVLRVSSGQSSGSPLLEGDDPDKRRVGTPPTAASRRKMIAWSLSAATVTTAVGVAVWVMGAWRPARRPADPPASAPVPSAALQGAPMANPSSPSTPDVKRTSMSTGSVALRARDASGGQSAGHVSVGARHDTAIVSIDTTETNKSAIATGTTPSRVDAKGMTSDSAVRRHPAIDSIPTSSPSSPSPVVSNPATTTSPANTMSGANAATLADARAVAREFATLCNQRRWRELDALGALSGGDAAVRRDLTSLVRSAAEFGAGFDRVASPPALTSDGFVTDVVLELTWQGGRRLVAIQLHASLSGGGWHVNAFGAVPAP